MDYIDEIDIKGRKLILRSDLNLPIEDGEPKPTLRFYRYAETIQNLSKQDAQLIILAHQGRPGREDFTHLEQHAELLDEHLEPTVDFVKTFFGREVEDAINTLENGDIILLENVRFLSEELYNASPKEHANDIFVRRLSKLADGYVNDAFSAAHRAHASMLGFVPLLDSYGGPVMKHEYQSCHAIRDELDAPVLVIGGEKPSDVISIMENMIDRCSTILLGGVPGEIALRLQGHSMGAKDEWLDRHVEREAVETLEYLLDNHPDTIEIPDDLAVDSGVVAPHNVPEEAHTWDIGPKTRDRYTSIIENAGSVVLKGPMGAFDKGFEEGSKAIIDAMANSNGFTVVSGGHSSSLVERFGYTLEDFGHVSIAGGAFVTYMSGEDLPGITALRKSESKTK